MNLFHSHFELKIPYKFQNVKSSSIKYVDFFINNNNIKRKYVDEILSMYVHFSLDIVIDRNKKIKFTCK